jgi:ArsR family transcriptional regulator
VFTIVVPPSGLRFTEGGLGSICTDCNPKFKGCQRNQPPRHVLFIVATAGIHEPNRRFRMRSLAYGIDICEYRRMSNQGGGACRVNPLVAEPLTMAAAAETAAKFKALSDPVRLRLLSSIASHAGGEACVCDISAGVEVSQPTVSHHLKVLRDAGLLTSQRRASWVYYAVVPGTLDALAELLRSVADSAVAEAVSR